jgi:geranylgeranyl diphosphate synthase type II
MTTVLANNYSTFFELEENSSAINLHLCYMETMQHFQEVFEAYLNKQTFNSHPKELYEPVRYILSLGGKRIRPALVLLANKAFNGSMEEAMPAAFAMELFHNFTLLHDDIMDKAELRRGKPTIHHKFGDNTAILSGDVMMIWCYKYLQLLPPEKFKAIFELFNDTAIKICEGQQMDMLFETKIDVEEADYLKMIELKTSVLLAACLKAGALLGNATKEDAEKMYEFGLNIGLAFQVQDDILDAFGEIEKVGKVHGGDIKNNKKTLLLLHAKNVAKDEDAFILNKLLSDNSESKVSQMIKLFEKLGVRNYAEKVAEDYHLKALKSLNTIVHISDASKKELQLFANYLLKREH